jgi:hypothetical protein
MTSKTEPGFAVVRLDAFLLNDCPNNEMLAKLVDDLDMYVRIKVVVATAEEAEQEVARLNSLVDTEEIRYFVATTRIVRR